MLCQSQLYVFVIYVMLCCVMLCYVMLCYVGLAIKDLEPLYVLKIAFGIEKQFTWPFTSPDQDV